MHPRHGIEPAAFVFKRPRVLFDPPVTRHLGIRTPSKDLARARLRALHIVMYTPLVTSIRICSSYVYWKTVIHESADGLIKKSFRELFLQLASMIDERISSKLTDRIYRNRRLSGRKEELWQGREICR